MVLFLVVSLLACTGPASKDPPGSPTPTGEPTPTVSPAPTPTATPGDPLGDEGLARALVDGSAPVLATLVDVAWSGGWPVQTASDTWLFVTWDASGPVSLAGDFNSWTPEPMTAGDGFYWTEVTLGDAPDGQKYKLVDGSDSYFADPWGRFYDYDSFGRHSYVRPPTDTPHMELLPNLEGQGLGARDVRVYVPSGTGPWPVLYAHDGQNLFDPDAIGGGWRLREALSLQAPMLVVGVDNTGVARMDEYTHVPDVIETGGPQVGGLGDAYAALVHEDLRPFIEGQYGSTGIDGQMGSSLGGLISLHIAHTYPGEYDFVASLSGTLGWGRFELGGPVMEERWLASDPGGTLYITNGGGTGADGVCTDPDGDGFPEDDPDGTDNYCTNRQFVDALAANGRTWDADLYHWWQPGASHSEAEWATVVGQPLTVFAGLSAP